MFLQAAANSQSGMINILFMVGIFVVFYFFMIRPQQKKAKEQKTFRENLKKGDKVVTIGGLHGEVVEVSKETVTLEVDRGTKLVFELSAISSSVDAKATK